MVTGPDQANGLGNEGHEHLAPTRAANNLNCAIPGPADDRSQT
jgi:hypothetical protein